MQLVSVCILEISQNHDVVRQSASSPVYLPYPSLTLKVPVRRNMSNVHESLRRMQ